MKIIVLVAALFTSAALVTPTVSDARGMAAKSGTAQLASA
jgi:hypothetical protein